jgi:hypothetical protein
MKLFIILAFIFLSFTLHAQYSFELKVDYATQIGNTNDYSVSGTLLKGTIENGKKYYLTSGAEFDVQNLMSAKTATSVNSAKAPEKVSIGLKCKNFNPKTGVVIKGISTQPNYSGMQMTNNRLDKLPEGILKVNINGMQFTATQISKPIKTKAGDVLDMFFKTKGTEVFWLQIGNLSKIEELPARVVSDSTLVGTDEPYCKIAFMPDGFLPTQLPNNYKAYEDKTGKASILITNLKKYTFQATIEFAGPLAPNWKILEENENAGFLTLTNGRVDKIVYEEH